MEKMSAIRSPRTRKEKREDYIRQEIVAQVHKSTKSNTSSENDYGNSEDNVEFVGKHEENENIEMHTPSVELSIDGESQINSKILSLIESEIKRENNRKTHFTDSRPQSLSFYEDEKMPEELSGNLELLSPEERKHFKKRKEYLQLDDERNIYNSITDMYNVRDTEDMITKKHKYRKKRHGETELGMGNSTEMMIPKEKPKRRKKKRENSPGCTNGKRKHKKRDDEYEVKNDITLALEELQDDVFENNHDEIFPKPERIKRSPRRADKVYIQKKNKFEYVGKPTNNNCIKDCEEGPNAKELSTYHPLQVAIVLQSWWIRISNVCHGLLGGLALGHWLYLICNINSEDNNFLIHYAYYSDMFVALFYGLCVVCIISVLDRIDIEELSGTNVGGLLKKKSSFIIIIYITCLILHLSASSLDDKIGNLSNNETMPNMTLSEVKTWNHLSLWRAIFAFTAWIFLGLVPSDDMLYINLKSMERFFPDK